jgi:hypothetical protein
LIVGDRFQIDWKEMRKDQVDGETLGLSTRTNGESIFKKPDWL